MRGEVRVRSGERRYLRPNQGRGDSRDAREADPGFGAYLDVDQEGNVLGVEFLSFEEFAELATQAGEKLDIPDTVREPGSVPATSPTSRKYGSEAIRKALSSLGPREQELLRLRYFENHTSPEIADHLGMSIAAVNSGTRLALGELRGA